MAPNYGPKIVTDGLALCLDAANPKSYPGSGTTWYDLSGNSRNASLLGGATYSLNNNGFIEFDGTDDYFKLGSYSPGDAGQSFSFGCWIKTFSTGTSNFFPLSNYTTGGQTAFFALVFNNSMNSTYAWLRNTSRNSFTTSAISLNLSQWYYFTVVRDSENSQLLFYVDGELSSSTTCPSSSTFKDSNSFYGGMRHSVGSWIQGNIGNTFIYEKALTATEVKQNFNALKGRYGS